MTMKSQSNIIIFSTYDNGEGHYYGVIPDDKFEIVKEKLRNKTYKHLKNL